MWIPHPCILYYIERAKSENATPVCGEGPVQETKGYQVTPTVSADVTNDMTIYQNIILGPVVVMSCFDTEDEAVTRVNNTTYGLGAAVFTKDI
jgi:aldehyde dehydrogenase (NAD(P)+)